MLLKKLEEIMKKFNTFINESVTTKSIKTDGKFESIIEIIEEHCSEFLDEIKNKEYLVFRGINTKTPNEILIENDHDFNRQPKDTEIEIHNHFNNFFYDEFGWYVRNGIFTTKSNITGYGNQDYIFIPFNGYSYCFSEYIADFTTETSELIVYPEGFTVTPENIEDVFNDCELVHNMIYLEIEYKELITTYEYYKEGHDLIEYQELLQKVEEHYYDDLKNRTSEIMRDYLQDNLDICPTENEISFNSDKYFLLHENYSEQLFDYLNKKSN